MKNPPSRREFVGAALAAPAASPAPPNDRVQWPAPRLAQAIRSRRLSSEEVGGR